MAAVESHGREMTSANADFDRERAALTQRLTTAEERAVAALGQVAAAEGQAAAAVAESEVLQQRVAALEAAAEGDRRTIADLEAEVGAPGTLIMWSVFFNCLQQFWSFFLHPISPKRSVFRRSPQVAGAQAAAEADEKSRRASVVGAEAALLREAARARELEHKLREGLAREGTLRDKGAEQEERIAALNEEWSSLQAEVRGGVERMRGWNGMNAV